MQGVLGPPLRGCHPTVPFINSVLIQKNAMTHISADLSIARGPPTARSSLKSKDDHRWIKIAGVGQSLIHLMSFPIMRSRSNDCHMSLCLVPFTIVILCCVC